MTQTVCVPTAEADVLLRLASRLRPGPPVHEELLTPDPSAGAQIWSFPSPSPSQTLGELFIVIRRAGRDYESHNATRQGGVSRRRAQSGYFKS